MSFFTSERSDSGGIINEMRGKEEGKKRGIKGDRRKLEKKNREGGKNTFHYVIGRSKHRGEEVKEQTWA